MMMNLLLLAQSGSDAAPAFFLIAIFGLLALAGFLLWLWSLIDCIRNPRLSDTNRIIGIVLIVFLNLLGSFIYLFLPRTQR